MRSLAVEVEGSKVLRLLPLHDDLSQDTVGSAVADAEADVDRLAVPASLGKGHMVSTRAGAYGRKAYCCTVVARVVTEVAADGTAAAGADTSQVSSCRCV